MKQFLLSTILISAILSISCDGGEVEIDDPLDIDPYFTETHAILTSQGPQSITRNILQDRNGNFWFATWEGIMHYDGKVFTNFTNKANLRRYRIFSLLEDQAGNIWFGTVGAGVYRYNPWEQPAEGEPVFYNYSSKDVPGYNEIECMFEDADGKIWFGTNAGVSCYDPFPAPAPAGEMLRHFSVNDGLLDGDIHSITQDKTGKIWIGSTEGICYYENGIFTHFTNEQDSAFYNVRTIIADKNGDILFGGSDGLFRYDGQKLTNLTTDFTGYLYEDKAGKIWISAGKGDNPNMFTLYCYDGISITEIIKGDGQIFGIIEDKEGGIWFGTGSGVCRYDPLAAISPGGKSFNYFERTW